MCLISDMLNGFIMQKNPSCQSLTKTPMSIHYYNTDISSLTFRLISL
jgi:hypothetical protein